jgi:hypothetical protein
MGINIIKKINIYSMKKYIEFIKEEFVYDSEKYNEEDGSWIESMYDELCYIKERIDYDIEFIIKNIKVFDKYQGPYAIVTISGRDYEIWFNNDNGLWIENYRVDNTSAPGQNSGFEGRVDEILDIINQTEKIHTYKGQKDIIENDMDDFDRIKDIALPEIKKEYPELFQAVDWGLIP